MKTGETPEDIFSQIDGNKTNLPAKTVTQSSAKVDESVKTLEDKSTNAQEVINYWRKKIMQNEEVITFFCVIIGMYFSWAVNICTGNYDIPPSVYILSSVIVFVVALLLIAPGALPLIVIVRFAIFMFIGHYFMMWVVSIDGHSFRFLTSDVCRYPFSFDVMSGVIAGAFIGYIYKSFEEIRAARKK